MRGISTSSWKPMAKSAPARTACAARVEEWLQFTDTRCADLQAGPSLSPWDFFFGLMSVLSSRAFRGLMAGVQGGCALRRTPRGVGRIPLEVDAGLCTSRCGHLG